MRILQIHNRYVHRGGEDTTVENENRLLADHGHDVRRLEVSNGQVIDAGPLAIARALGGSAWSPGSLERVKAEIRHFRPHVMHVHNIWFAWSPSVFGASKALGVPSVLTQQNYRLMCPNAYLLRDGKVCELCVGTHPLRSIQYGCYRGSRVQSAVLSRMILSNRRRGTWTDMVDGIIAVTQFVRGKFIEGGLPGHKIHVKGNFLATDPGPSTDAGAGALYVGRLSTEKGVDVLLDAWARPSLRDRPLKIVGDGPAQDELRRRSKDIPGVEFVGRIDSAAVHAAMRKAAFIIMPSVWYECFPLVLVEAFALGRTVLASRLGSMAEIVREDIGRVFSPGNAADLAAKAEEMFADPDGTAALGRAARACFERDLSAQRNYERLIEIYAEVGADVTV